MTPAPVQFTTRCTCGAALKCVWDTPVHSFEWDEVKKQQCLVVEPCGKCAGLRQAHNMKPDDWYHF